MDTTVQWNQCSELIATSSALADIVAKGNKSYSIVSSSENTADYDADLVAWIDGLHSDT